MAASKKTRSKTTRTKSAAAAAAGSTQLSKEQLVALLQGLVAEKEEEEEEEDLLEKLELDAKTRKALARLFVRIGEKNIHALARNLKKAKSQADVRRAFRKVSNNTQSRYFKTDLLDEEPSTEYGMTSGQMWALILAGLAAAGGAAYVGHRMGHRRGMKDLAEASLDAMTGHSAELRLLPRSSSSRSRGSNGSSWNTIPGGMSLTGT